MYRQRLKEYIEEDVIYQVYKEQKEFESSDFDNFGILHCEDIEEALFDLEQLRKENKKLQNKIHILEDELEWYKQECDDLEMSSDVDECE